MPKYAKRNDNGPPPGHPNAPSPGERLSGAVAEAVEEQREDMDLVEAQRNRSLGLNEFTRKAPWRVAGNEPNQE